MKQSELMISFDGEKLSALRRYMAKKEMNLEAELNDAVQKLYEKFVPAPVREYIEDNAAPTPAVKSPRQRREAKPSLPDTSPESEVSE